MDTRTLGDNPPKGVHVPKSHPPYPAEFRAEAVRLVREGGRTPDELAQVLGCSGQVIRNWLRQADLDAGRRIHAAPKPRTDRDPLGGFPACFSAKSYRYSGDGRTGHRSL